MKTTKQIDSIDDILEIEEELVKSGKMSKNNKNYINNKELHDEYVRYNKIKEEWEENGWGIPPLTEKIGAAIIQIATRRCNSRLFQGYTNAWKEEFISHAIMTATIRGHNYNPIYDNPFAYLTQICNNAIVEQLKKEKKHLYIKYKKMEEMDGFAGDNEDQNVTEEMFHTGSDDHYQASVDRKRYINDFEESAFPAKKAKKKDEGILQFIEDDESDDK